MVKKDATGHMRGAGTYSRSYPKLAAPPMRPDAREVYGDISVTAANNRGFPAGIKQSGKSRKSTGNESDD
jgi:hypothetical protein